MPSWPFWSRKKHHVRTPLLSILDTFLCQMSTPIRMCGGRGEEFYPVGCCIAVVARARKHLATLTRKLSLNWSPAMAPLRGAGFRCKHCENPGDYTSCKKAYTKSNVFLTFVKWLENNETHCALLLFEKGALFYQVFQALSNEFVIRNRWGASLPAIPGNPWFRSVILSICTYFDNGSEAGVDVKSDANPCFLLSRDDPKMIPTLSNTKPAFVPPKRSNNGKLGDSENSKYSESSEY